MKYVSKVTVNKLFQCHCYCHWQTNSLKSLQSNIFSTFEEVNFFKSVLMITYILTLQYNNNVTLYFILLQVWFKIVVGSKISSIHSFKSQLSDLNQNLASKYLHSFYLFPKMQTSWVVDIYCVTDYRAMALSTLCK